MSFAVEEETLYLGKVPPFPDGGDPTFMGNTRNDRDLASLSLVAPGISLHM